MAFTAALPPSSHLLRLGVTPSIPLTFLPEDKHDTHRCPWLSAIGLPICKAVQTAFLCEVSAKAEVLELILSALVSMCHIRKCFLLVPHTTLREDSS